MNQRREFAGEVIELLAMRLHRVQSTIGRLMTVVAVSAIRFALSFSLRSFTLFHVQRVNLLDSP